MLQKVNLKKYIKIYILQAAEVGLAVATDEQRNGNYTVAHHILRDLVKEMRKERGYAPLDLVKSLEVLHSYLLIKKLIKIEDYIHGALNIIRVINNLSYFPQSV